MFNIYFPKKQTFRLSALNKLFSEQTVSSLVRGSSLFQKNAQLVYVGRIVGVKKNCFANANEVWATSITGYIAGRKEVDGELYSARPVPAPGSLSLQENRWTARASRYNAL